MGARIVWWGWMAVLSLVLVGGIQGLFCTMAWPGEETVEKATADTVAPATAESIFGAMKVSGTLHSTYQFRDFDGQDDHDIYEYLSLKVDNLIYRRVDAAFSMIWHEDLNGDTPLRTGVDYDPFIDLDQASDNRFRFFTGYIDVKDLIFDDSHLVLGRQFLEEIDYAHFDGATYRFSPL